MLEPGTEVLVTYTGYHIGATVLEETRDGERAGRGWVPVRQNVGYDAAGEVQEHNDYRAEPERDRPEFLVGEEYISLPGEPLKPGPLENMARGLGYLNDR